MRNIGSSIGIPLVSALLSQYTQVNHAELAAPVTPFNPAVETALDAAPPADAAAME